MEDVIRWSRGPGRDGRTRRLLEYDVGPGPMARPRTYHYPRHGLKYYLDGDCARRPLDAVHGFARWGEHFRARLTVAHSRKVREADVVAFHALARANARWLLGKLRAGRPVPKAELLARIDGMSAALSRVVEG